MAVRSAAVEGGNHGGKGDHRGGYGNHGGHDHYRRDNEVEGTIFLLFGKVVADRES